MDTNHTTMAETLSKHEKNLAAIIHASTFSKYFLGIFTVPFMIGIIPEIFHLADFNFANFNEFNGINLDFHSFHPGRLLWPLGIVGAAHLGLFLVNIVYTILATIRTSEGLDFQYPISIPFIR